MTEQMYCLYGIWDIGNGGSSSDMPMGEKKRDNNMAYLNGNGNSRL